MANLHIFSEDSTSICGYVKTLMNLIKNYNDKITGRIDDESAKLDHGCEFFLETKYYTVKVNTSHIHFGDLLSSSSNILSPPFDTMVVINPNIDHLKEISQFLTIDKFDFKTKLLVRIEHKSDLSNRTEVESIEHFESKYTQLLEWSVDNGFELIVVNLNSPFDSWDCREKDGLPRLMEALHATMWTDMEVKNTQKINININNSGNSPGTMLDGLSMLSSNLGYDHDKLFSSPSPIVSNHKEDNDRNKNPSKEDEDEIKSSKVIDGLDFVDDEFTRLTEIAQRYKDELASGNVSDEIRRHRAAEVATRMAKLLGLGIDHDENEDRVAD